MELLPSSTACQNVESKWLWCPTPADTPAMQPLYPRLQEKLRRGGRKSARAEARDTCCYAVSPRRDRENAPMKYQQYGCLNKTDVITFPFLDLRFHWITLESQCLIFSMPKNHLRATLKCEFLGFSLRDFNSLGQYRDEELSYWTNIYEHLQCAVIILWSGVPRWQNSLCSMLRQGRNNRQTVI